MVARARLRDVRISPAVLRVPLSLFCTAVLLTLWSDATPAWAQRASSTAEAGARLRAIGTDTARGRSSAVVVESGALVHTALIHAIDADGRVHGGSDATAQVAYVLGRLEVALEAAGTGLDRVARLHVYVADPSVTAAVDRLLAERFGGNTPPAVTLVQSRMPRQELLVAMDAVAVTGRPPQGAAAARLVVDGLAAKPGRAAHVAVQPEGPFVIISGRAAPGEFETAVRDTMKQLRGDLQTVDLTFEHAVHVKAFLADMSRAEQLQQIVASMFDGTPPPIVVTEWKDAALPVEIELVATAPGATSAERVTFVEPILSRYSRIARVFSGHPVFVSGLTGAAPEPAAQVREIFTELARLLALAGSDMRHVAKATYYVADAVADREINTIRPSVYEASRPPAASKISVAGTGRAGRGTTIDAIAVTVSR